MVERMRTIFQENIKFFKQTVKLSVSDLIKTYKGAALGPLWAVIKPSFLIFVYWFAFHFGLRKSGAIQGHPFVLWLIVGNIPWVYISEIISTGAGSIRANKHFVTKMPFPMSTIMTFTSLSKLYVHIVLLGIVAIIVLANGYKIDIYWIQLLYYMPMMFLFFTVLSWITAPLSAISKDFLNLVKSIISGLFWATGIVWDTYAMKPGAVQAIMFMNPINYFVNGYRNIFLYKRWFFQTRFETVSFLVILAITMIVGSRVFLKLRKDIPDVL
jgi:teichoic acid transport system permease protein